MEVTKNTFEPESFDPLDSLGRVIDFGEIKARLCNWLEEYWDHKFIAWSDDPLLKAMVHSMQRDNHQTPLIESIVWVNFNPTAENMAKYLVEEIGPEVLAGTGVELIECHIEETRKCSCTYTKEVPCKC
jgi:6-pyruvoyltetrahydropterin/6-carboxytetrahydropterin synthase